MSLRNETTSARRVGTRVALALGAVAIGAAMGTWVVGGSVHEPAHEASIERARPAPSAIEEVPVVEVAAPIASDAGIAIVPATPIAEPAPVIEEERPAPRARRARRRRVAAAPREAEPPRTPSVVHGTPILTDLP